MIKGGAAYPYILKASIHILAQKWPKVAQIWPKNAQNGPRMTQNGLKMTQNDPKMTRTFSAILFDWKGGSANFFAFRMYDCYYNNVI